MLRITKRDWEKLVQSFSWAEESIAHHPPLAYANWMKKNSHHHEYSELLISLWGTHLYGVDGKAIKLAPGAAILIPRTIPHDATYSKYHAECLDLWLHFLPHGAVHSNFLYHHPKSGWVSEPIPSLTTTLQEEFRKAGCLLNQRYDSFAWGKIRHYLSYLLFEVFDFFMEADLDNQPSNDRSVITEVKCYAMQHLTDRLTLADLAKAAGYSPFHFHRIFLEAEGMTPRAFVEAHRLKNACRLLKAGQSVTSSALDSGFSSSSQFNQVFKKQFQLSPMQWLKTAR